MRMEKSDVFPHRARLYSHFQPVDVQTILDEHGDDIYLESPNQNPDAEKVDDLVNLPMTYDDGSPVLIYDKDGILIRRQMPVMDAADDDDDDEEMDALFEGPGCGMLLDLRSVHTMFEMGRAYEEAVELFRREETRRTIDRLSNAIRERAEAAGEERPDEDVELSEEQKMDIEDCIQTRLSHYHHFEGTGQGLRVFPQAFTGHYGNIQTDDMIPVYLPSLANIDHNLRVNQPERPARLESPENEDENGEEEDADANERARWRRLYGIDAPFIEPHGCQVYNEISHRTRPTAGQQETCNGGLSKAATAPWGPSTDASRRKRQKLIRQNSLMLPHERFEYVIKDPLVDRSLRLENTFTVHLARMPLAIRNGE